MDKTKQNIFITNNFGETQKLAENFISRFKKRDVLALYGNLGSGKTTFVQGLARGFGIKKRIISPTFIIVREYNLKTSHFATHFAKATRVKKASRDKQNSKLFYHVDLYRVESEKEVRELGIEEMISDNKSLVAIEWAEKMQSLLPKKRWDIKFEDLGGSKRKITINQKL